MSKTGGPAFPVAGYTGNRGAVHGTDGMSLRDYFAGQAMAALIVAPGQIGDEARAHQGKAAEWGYVQADAMLKARDQ